MTRTVCLLILFSAILPAQSGDSQTLQGILQEIRLLRQEIPATNLVAQRVQILLYRARVQEDTVSKAKQRADQATAKLKDAERARAMATTSLKEIEDKLALTQDQKERSALEEARREFKRRAEMWSQDEERFRETETAAISEMRAEEARLAELQQKLDKIERQLEAYSTDLPTK